MPLLSVITAAYAPGAHFIEQARDSVLSQVLPDGWELEWIVQEDGDEPSLRKFLTESRIVYAANRGRLGVAMTRNLALAHARGSLVQVLDHDDMLLPGAHQTLIPLFNDSRVHWAIGEADDLHPDGTRHPYASSFPHGTIHAGQVNRWARENGGNWPIHCANLMMRTSSVRAMGGWIASPADDDVAMFAGLSEITGGYNTTEHTWLYRIHPNQASQSDEWKRRSEDGRRIALQRALAVADSGLTLTASLDHDNVASIDEVRVGPPIKG